MATHAPYKYSFYSEYCYHIRSDEAGRQEKYSHYLDLMNAFVHNWVQEDDELLEAGSGIELEEIAGADDQTAPVTPADAVLVAVVRGEDSLRPADAGDPIPGDRLVVLGDNGCADD